MSSAKPRPESPRELIARVLPEVVTEQRIRELIESAFTLMQGTYVADGTCVGCGKPKKVRVLIPDLKATVSVLTAWLEEGFGRPGTAAMEVRHIDVQTLADLEALSDYELAAIARRS